MMATAGSWIAENGASITNEPVAACHHILIFPAQVLPAVGYNPHLRTIGIPGSPSARRCQGSLIDFFAHGLIDGIRMTWPCELSS